MNCGCCCWRRVNYVFGVCWLNEVERNYSLVIHLAYRHFKMTALNQVESIHNWSLKLKHRRRRKTRFFFYQKNEENKQTKRKKKNSDPICVVAAEVYKTTAVHLKRGWPNRLTMQWPRAIWDTMFVCVWHYIPVTFPPLRNIMNNLLHWRCDTTAEMEPRHGCRVVPDCQTVDCAAIQTGINAPKILLEGDGEVEACTFVYVSLNYIDFSLLNVKYYRAVDSVPIAFC